MNSETLRDLLSQPEGLKLEFKSEYKLNDQPPANTNQQYWRQYVAGQWDEFIKDILALTHGNVGTATQPGYMIIGADNTLQADGTRQLYDTSTLQLSQDQIIQAVNRVCHPPLPDIQVERIMLDGNSILVISIPPSPYLHETIRRLETTNGRFDEHGILRHVQPGPVYTEGTVFVRRGEGIGSARQEERKALEQERLALFPQARQARLSSIISAIEKILKITNDSLVENQQVLIPLLRGRGNRRDISYQLYQLYDGRQNLPDYEECLAYLQDCLAQGTNGLIRPILEELIAVLTDVHRIFYDYYDNLDAVSEEVMRRRKQLVAQALEDENVDGAQAIALARGYLDHLRNAVSVIGRNLGKLRALPQ